MFDMVDGKLFFDADERLMLLGLLLENVGRRRSGATRKPGRLARSRGATGLTVLADWSRPAQYVRQRSSYR